jgi:hypothetical protein
VSPAGPPGPPASNPIAPAPTTTPPVAQRVSLKVSRHGHLLVVLLVLGGRAQRVVLVASTPRAQLGVARPKNDRGAPVVLARLVRANVGAGETRLVVALDARALARGRRLTLALTATVYSAGVAPQRTVGTLVLTGR